MIVRRDGDRVRLFTRCGHDWTHRFGSIVHSLRALRVSSVTLDGEMVVCDEDGISVFAKLHSQSYDGQAFLYAFDLLELNGDDYKREPLDKRKAKLAKLLAPAEPGIRLNEHLEDDGATIFRDACKLGWRA
jgi:bifunctional non-homologous end joining protein LigD